MRKGSLTAGRKWDKIEKKSGEEGGGGWDKWPFPFKHSHFIAKK